MIGTAVTLAGLATIYLTVGLAVANVTAGPDTLDTHPLGVAVAWPAVVVVAAVGIAIMYVASTDA